MWLCDIILICSKQSTMQADYNAYQFISFFIHVDTTFAKNAFLISCIFNKM